MKDKILSEETKERIKENVYWLCIWQINIYSV